jgi:hypothetical protein
MSGVRAKLAVGLLVAAGIALVAAANGHLVYVAVTSQPDCVAHLKPGVTAPAGSFSAARSAC